jgi:predicted Zn-dependent protease
MLSGSDDAPAVKGQLFKVKAGEVYVRSRPGRTVWTEAALISVRGTEFSVFADGGTSRVLVVRGSVDYANDLGAVTVNQGQVSAAAVGTAPSAPATIQAGDMIFEWVVDLSRSRILIERNYASPGSPSPRDLAASRTPELKSASNDTLADLTKADIASDSGRYDDAIVGYQRVLARAPASAEVVERLACALLNADHVDDAIETIARITDIRKQSLLRAWTALRTNRFNDAILLARQASSSPALAPEANLVIGISQARLPNGLAEARATLTALTKSSPAATGQALAWLALLDADAGNTETALSEAREAVKRSPLSPTAHSALSMVQFSRANFDEAAREARVATSLDPRDVASTIVQAQAYLATGQPNAASACAAVAVALAPKVPEAHYILALADIGRGDLSHADRELQDCLALAPKYTPAQAALVRLKIRQGAAPAAAKLAKSSISGNPQSAELHTALADAFYATRNYTAATFEYREALRTSPTSALAYCGLSQTYLDQGKYNDAISAGMSAVRLAPNVAQYHAVLGQAYEYAFGNGSGAYSANAANEFREALAIDPSNGLARIRLAMMRFGSANQGSGLAGASSVQLSSISQGYEIFPDAQRQKNAQYLIAGVTQALIDNPSSTDRLYPGGVQTELAAETGGAADVFSLSHRDRLANGTEHDIVQYTNSLNRMTPRGVGRSENLIGFVNQKLPDRASIVGGLIHQRSQQAFPPALGLPTVSQTSSGNVATFVYAKRPNDNTLLQAAVTGLYTSDSYKNPFESVKTILSKTNTVASEVRMDWRTASSNQFVPTYTLGYSGAPQSIAIDRDLLFDWDPGAPIHDALRYSQNVNNAYAEVRQRLSSSVDYIAYFQYRWVASTDVSYGGDTLMPRFQVSYRGNTNTAVRLQAGRFANETTLSPLTPQNALAAVEPDAFTFGLARDSDVTELDVEHNFGSTTVKAFGFHTISRKLTFSDALPQKPYRPTVVAERVYHDGIGLRVQHPVTNSLFASFYVVASTTSNHANLIADEVILFDDNVSPGPLPYTAGRKATLELQYQRGSGVRVSAAMRYEDHVMTREFVPDVSGTLVGNVADYPARTYLDLKIAKDIRRDMRIHCSVLNVFNTPSIQFTQLKTGQRTIQVGAALSF